MRDHSLTRATNAAAAAVAVSLSLAYNALMALAAGGNKGRHYTVDH